MIHCDATKTGFIIDHFSSWQVNSRGVTTIEAGEALASSILDRSKVKQPFKTGARSQ